MTEKGKVLKEKEIQASPEVARIVMQNAIRTSDGGYLICGYNGIEDVETKVYFCHWLLKLNQELEIQKDYRWNCTGLYAPGAMNLVFEVAMFGLQRLRVYFLPRLISIGKEVLNLTNRNWKLSMDSYWELSVDIRNFPMGQYYIVAVAPDKTVTNNLRVVGTTKF